VLVQIYTKYMFYTKVKYFRIFNFGQTTSTSTVNSKKTHQNRRKSHSFDFQTMDVIQHWTIAGLYRPLIVLFISKSLRYNTVKHSKLLPLLT